MVLRFGKLCLADVQLEYDDPQFPNELICGKIGGHYSDRTPLKSIIKKSEMSCVLENMIETNRRNRPTASDILQNRAFRNCIMGLGCTEDNLDCGLGKWS